ncbi:MAG: pro-sigmaK processing inhibitor BofA family protein [Candidatus Heteroscillospira sp.]|jgi:inhibitor of the pro-sigma K processing machinery
MLIVFFIIILGIATGILSILFKLLKKPIGLAFKLLLNALSGFVFLFVFNILGSFFEISLGLNFINALVAGVLGVPGVVLLLLVKYLI